VGGKTSTSTSQVSIPPDVLARYNAVNATAQQTAAQPFQQYSTNPSAFVAPLTSTQQAGIAGTNAAANLAQPYYQSATGFAMAGANPINATPLDPSTIQQYENPYLSSVLGSTEALINQQNQQGMMGQTANAINQGYFGGDRSGIAAATLAGQQQLAAGQTYSGIASDAYNQALAAAQQQQGVNLSAEQANRAAIQQTGETLAGLGTTAQQSALAGAQAQLGAGQTAQQTQQAGLTALYNQFLQQQSYPFQVAQFLANIAEGTGALSGSTTTTQQPQSIFSDERLKTDMEPIGQGFDGANIYRFRYRGDPTFRIGFSAQEIAGLHPEAVHQTPSGFLAVNYDLATRHAAGFARAANDNGNEPIARRARAAGGRVARQAGGMSQMGMYPAGVNPYSIAELLQAQQAMYAPFSQSGLYGGQSSGLPHGGSSYVPAASMPVPMQLHGTPPPVRPQGNVLQAGANLADVVDKWSTAAPAVAKGYHSLHNAVTGQTDPVADATSGSATPAVVVHDTPYPERTDGANAGESGGQVQIDPNTGQASASASAGGGLRTGDDDMPRYGYQGGGDVAQIAAAKQREAHQRAAVALAQHAQHAHALAQTHAAAAAGDPDAARALATPPNPFSAAVEVGKNLWPSMQNFAKEVTPPMRLWPGDPSAAFPAPSITAKQYPGGAAGLAADVDPLAGARAVSGIQNPYGPGPTINQRSRAAAPAQTLALTPSPTILPGVVPHPGVAGIGTPSASDLANLQGGFAPANLKPYGGPNLFQRIGDFAENTWDNLRGAGDARAMARDASAPTAAAPIQSEAFQDKTLPAPVQSEAFQGQTGPPVAHVLPTIQSDAFADQTPIAIDPNPVLTAARGGAIRRALALARGGYLPFAEGGYAGSDSPSSVRARAIGGTLLSDLPQPWRGEAGAIGGYATDFAHALGLATGGRAGYQDGGELSDPYATPGGGGGLNIPTGGAQQPHQLMQPGAPPPQQQGGLSAALGEGANLATIGTGLAKAAPAIGSGLSAIGGWLAPMLMFAKDGGRIGYADGGDLPDQPIGPDLDIPDESPRQQLAVAQPPKDDSGNQTMQDIMDVAKIAAAFASANRGGRIMRQGGGDTPSGPDAGDQTLTPKAPRHATPPPATATDTPPGATSPTAGAPGADFGAADQSPPSGGGGFFGAIGHLLGGVGHAAESVAGYDPNTGQWNRDRLMPLLSAIGAIGATPTVHPLFALSQGLSQYANSYMAQQQQEAQIGETQARTGQIQWETLPPNVRNALYKKQGVAIDPQTGEPDWSRTFQNPDKSHYYWEFAPNLIPQAGVKGAPGSTGGGPSQVVTAQAPTGGGSPTGGGGSPTTLRGGPLTMDYGHGTYTVLPSSTSDAQVAASTGLGDQLDLSGGARAAARNHAMIGANTQLASLDASEGKAADLRASNQDEYNTLAQNYRTLGIAINDVPQHGFATMGPGADKRQYLENIANAASRALGLGNIPGISEATTPGELIAKIEALSSMKLTQDAGLHAQGVQSMLQGVLPSLETGNVGAANQIIAKMMMQNQKDIDFKQFREGYVSKYGTNIGVENAYAQETNGMFANDVPSLERMLAKGPNGQQSMAEYLMAHQDAATRRSYEWGVRRGDVFRPGLGVGITRYFPGAS